MTLTTQDKKDIREIVDGALVKFAEGLIKPSFELVYKKFSRVDTKLEAHDQEFEEIKEELRVMDKKLDLVAEKVTSHEKRISRPEEVPVTSS